MVGPRIKFTLNDYMTAPPDKRYQLLDGELILAPSPTTRHQRILFRLSQVVNQFVVNHRLGEVFVAPCDVVLSNYDVAQPDVLFVSNERSDIVTESNIQGAPDLVGKSSLLAPPSTTVATSAPSMDDLVSGSTGWWTRNRRR